MEQEIKKVVNKVKKNKDVLAVMLFGSYAGRKISPLSDVDLCVILNKKYSSKEMTRKRLKYLTYASNKFDIQIFQLLPLYIKIKILKEHKILYSKNTRKIYDIAYQTIKEYESFKPKYEDYIEKVTK